jgi:hypothetical protein
MHGSLPLLVVFFALASRGVCGMARNLQTAARVSHHAQTVPHYSAGCADFFRFQVRKARYCSSRLFSDAMSSLT